MSGFAGLGLGTSVSTKDVDVSGKCEGTPVPISCGVRRVNGRTIWCASGQTQHSCSSDDYFARYNYAYSSAPSASSGMQMWDPAAITVYFYTIDFVVSLGEHLAPALARGDVQITELRATTPASYSGGAGKTSQLLWSRNAGYSRRYFPDVSFEVFLGAEDQEPPPILLAANSKSPAYRGQILVVVRNFPIQPIGLSSGLTLPIITATINDGIILVNDDVGFDQLGVVTTHDRAGIIGNVATGTIYTYNDSVPNAAKIRVWNNFAQAEVANIDVVGDVKDYYGVSSPYDAFGFGRMWGGGMGNAPYDIENDLLVINLDSASNTRPICTVKPATGEVLGQFGYVGNALGPHPEDGGSPSHYNGMPWMVSGQAQAGVLVGGTWTDHVFILTYGLDGSMPPLIAYEAVVYLGMFPRMLQFYSKPDTGAGANVNRVWACAGSGVYEARFNFVNGLATFKSWTIMLIQGGSTWLDGQFYSVFDCGAGFSCFYAKVLVNNAPAKSSNQAIVFSEGPGGTLRVQKIACYVMPQTNQWYSTNSLGPGGWQVAWTVDLPGYSSTATSVNSILQSDFSNGTFGVFKGDDVAVIDLELGIVTYYPSSTPVGFPSVAGSDYIWNADGTVTYGDGGNLYNMTVGKANSPPVILKDWLAWVCAAIKLVPDQYYIDSSLTDEMDGCSIEELYYGAKLFRDMGKAYNFSFFESDGRLKFVRAAVVPGQSTPVVQKTLTNDDMAMISEGDAGEHDCLITELVKPSSNSSNVSIQFKYFYAFFDFWKSTTYNSDPTKPASSTVDAANLIKLPIFMTIGEATRKCARISIMSLGAKITQTFRLPWRYSMLEPSDAVGIDLHGKNYIVILRTVTYNGDWSISCEGENFQYSTDVDVDVNDDPTPPVDTTGWDDCYPVILDTPLFTPYTDDPSMAVLQVGVSDYGQANWKEGSLQSKLVTETTLQPVQSFTDETKCGTLVSDLPDTHVPHCTDWYLEIVVAATSLRWGDLANATDLDWFRNGYNCVVIGAPGRWEQIYFNEVEQLGPRTFKLKNGILRGRRGTDVFTGGHVKGDAVVLVSSQAEETSTTQITHLARYKLDPTEVGLDRVYQAVGGYTKGVIKEITTKTEGNSLKPWAPVHHKAVLAAGDITLTWERRDRLFGDWVDGTAAIPLSEASEKYDLEIYSGPGGTLKRTEVDLVAASFVYTAAMCSTDGLSSATSLTLKVYQKSAVVGRGFSKEVTIDVH